jgi:hypothetical protein
MKPEHGSSTMNPAQRWHRVAGMKTRPREALISFNPFVVIGFRFLIGSSLH